MRFVVKMVVLAIVSLTVGCEGEKSEMSEMKLRLITASQDHSIVYVTEENARAIVSVDWEKMSPVCRVSARKGLKLFPLTNIDDKSLYFDVDNWSGESDSRAYRFSDQDFTDGTQTIMAPENLRPSPVSSISDEEFLYGLTAGGDYMLSIAVFNEIEHDVRVLFRSVNTSEIKWELPIASRSYFRSNSGVSHLIEEKKQWLLLIVRHLDVASQRNLTFADLSEGKASYVSEIQSDYHHFGVSSDAAGILLVQLYVDDNLFDVRQYRLNHEADSTEMPVLEELLLEMLLGSKKFLQANGEIVIWFNGETGVVEGYAGLGASKMKLIDLEAGPVDELNLDDSGKLIDVRIGMRICRYTLKGKQWSLLGCVDLSSEEPVSSTAQLLIEP